MYNNSFVQVHQSQYCNPHRRPLVLAKTQVTNLDSLLNEQLNQHTIIIVDSLQIRSAPKAFAGKSSKPKLRHCKHHCQHPLCATDIKGGTAQRGFCDIDNERRPKDFTVLHNVILWCY